MNHKTLYRRSIEIIKKHQDRAGSYIASPNFEVYAYCWLRDGSYTAAAMDAVGEHSSARAFHKWVDQVIGRYRHKIGRIQQALANGQLLEDRDFLFTRYSLAGYEDMTDESWGNFQYDGYGTWLWALQQHYQMTGNRQLVADVWQSVRDVLDYLSLVWRLPSYDCWEEHPELLHPYSLSCVYGGMQAARTLAKNCNLPLDRDTIASEAEKIRQFILDNGVCEGVIVKNIYPEIDKNPYCQSSIDSNLLGLIYPYQMVQLDSDLGQAILNEVRNELISESGGVYRYSKDTYYGGGTWILLTAWLGWVEAENGEVESAQTRLDWIADKADGQGRLPEQLVDEVLFPDMVDPWVIQRGPVANPLLWSHAMYLILNENLKHQKDKV